MFNKWQKLISGNSASGSQSVALSLSIARCKADLEKGFQLLFRTRIGEDWSQDDFRGMRVSPYHLLPTTTMFIAKTKTQAATGNEEEKVVGTLTLIKAGPFDLPGVTGDLGIYQRCGELAELAVEPEFSASAEFIKQQLLAFAAGYALNYVELDTLLVDENVMVPKDQRKSLSGSAKIKIYKKVEFKDLSAKLAATTEVRWPERLFQKTLDPAMNAMTMEYFFGTRSSIFQRFSLQQKVRALQAFRGGPYFDLVMKILDMEKAPDFTIQRASSRFEVHLKGKVIDHSGNSFDVLITKVSRKGLALTLPTVVDQDVFRNIVEVQAQLKEDLWCSLKVKPISFQNFRSTERGFEILDADKVWFSFIYYLTVDHYPEEGRQAA